MMEATAAVICAVSVFIAAILAIGFWYVAEAIDRHAEVVRENVRMGARLSDAMEEISERYRISSWI